MSKYPPIIRVIAGLLVITFLAQDIVFADPDLGRTPPYTLQIPSRYGYPTPEIVLSDTLKYVLLLTKDRVVGELNLRLTPNIREGSRLVIDFSSKYRGEGHDSGWIVPCSSGGARYEAVIRDDRTFIIRPPGAEDIEPSANHEPAQETSVPAPRLRGRPVIPLKADSIGQNASQGVKKPSLKKFVLSHIGKFKGKQRSVYMALFGIVIGIEGTVGFGKYAATLSLAGMAISGHPVIGAIATAFLFMLGGICRSIAILIYRHRYPDVHIPWSVLVLAPGGAGAIYTMLVLIFPTYKFREILMLRNIEHKVNTSIYYSGFRKALSHDGLAALRENTFEIAEDIYNYQREHFKRYDPATRSYDPKYRVFFRIRSAKWGKSAARDTYYQLMNEKKRVLFVDTREQISRVRARLKNKIGKDVRKRVYFYDVEKFLVDMDDLKHGRIEALPEKTYVRHMFKDARVNADPPGTDSVCLAMTGFPWRWVRPDGGIDWARMKADIKSIFSYTLYDHFYPLIALFALSYASLASADPVYTVTPGEMGIGAAMAAGLAVLIIAGRHLINLYSKRSEENTRRVYEEWLKKKGGAEAGPDNIPVDFGEAGMGNQETAQDLRRSAPRGSVQELTGFISDNMRMPDGEKAGSAAAFMHGWIAGLDYCVSEVRLGIRDSGAALTAAESRLISGAVHDFLSGLLSADDFAGYPELERFLKDLFGKLKRINIKIVLTNEEKMALKRKKANDAVSAAARSLENDFAMLGLKPGATWEEVDKKWKKLCHQLHPDKTKGDKALENRLKIVNGAHDNLKQARKRNPEIFKKPKDTSVYMGMNLFIRPRPDGGIDWQATFGNRLSNFKEWLEDKWTNFIEWFSWRIPSPYTTRQIRRIRRMGHRKDADALTDLIRAAQDEMHTDARITALKELERNYGEHSANIFIWALEHDPDYSVRNFSAVALARLKDKRAIAPLTKAFRRSNEQIETRYAILDAIISLSGDRAAPLILRMVRSEVDYALIEILFSILPPLLGLKAADYFMDVVENVEDTYVKVYALKELGKLRDSKALPVICGSLDHANTRVKIAAVNAISDIGDPVAGTELVKRLNKYDDSQVIRAFFKAIERLDVKDPLLAGTLSAIIKGPYDHELRMSAIRLLTNVNAPGLEDVLIETLDDSNHVMVMEAIRTLGLMKSVRAVNPLIYLLASNKSGRSVNSMRLLDKMTEGSVLADTGLRMTSAENDIFDAVALSLWRIGTPKAQTYANLIRGHLTAINADDENVLQFLIEALKYHPIIRHRAANAMRGADSIRARLYHSLYHRAFEWIYMAGSNLLDNFDDEIRQALRSGPEVAMSAARVAGRLKMTALVPAMNDAIKRENNADTRLALIEGLAAIGTPETVDGLVEGLKYAGIDNYIKIRDIAIESLRRLGDRVRKARLFVSLYDETNIDIPDRFKGGVNMAGLDPEYYNAFPVETANIYRKIDEAFKKTHEWIISEGTDIIPELLEALDSERWINWHAARHLMALKEKSAAVPIIRMMLKISADSGTYRWTWKPSMSPKFITFLGELEFTPEEIREIEAIKPPLWIMVLLYKNNAASFSLLPGFSRFMHVLSSELETHPQNTWEGLITQIEESTKTYLAGKNVRKDERQDDSYKRIAGLLELVHDNLQLCLTSLTASGLTLTRIAPLIKTLPFNNPLTRIIRMFGEQSSVVGGFRSVTASVLESGHFDEVFKLILEIAERKQRAAPQEVEGMFEILNSYGNGQVVNWTDRDWASFADDIHAYYDASFKIITPLFFQYFRAHRNDEPALSVLRTDIDRELKQMAWGNFYGLTDEFRSRYNIGTVDEIALIARFLQITNFAGRDYENSYKAVKASLDSRGIKAWQDEIPAPLRELFTSRGTRTMVIYQRSSDSDEEDLKGLQDTLSDYASAEEPKAVFPDILHISDRNRSEIKKLLARLAIPKDDMGYFSEIPNGGAEEREWLSRWHTVIADTLANDYRNMIELKVRDSVEASSLSIEGLEELLSSYGVRWFDIAGKKRLMANDDEARGYIEKGEFDKLEEYFFAKWLPKIRFAESADIGLFEKWVDKSLGRYAKSNNAENKASGIRRALTNARSRYAGDVMEVLRLRKRQLSQMLIGSAITLFNEDLDSIRRHLANYKDVTIPSDERLYIGFFDDLLHLAGEFMMTGVCTYADRSRQVDDRTNHFGTIALKDSGGRVFGFSQVQILKVPVKGVPDRSAKQWRVLALTGINLSEKGLPVDRKKAVLLILKAAKELAKAAGLQGVVIPDNPGINSNQNHVHQIISELCSSEHLTKKSLTETVVLSRSPAYSYRDVLMVDTLPEVDCEPVHKENFIKAKNKEAVLVEKKHLPVHESLGAIIYKDELTDEAAKNLQWWVNTILGTFPPEAVREMRANLAAKDIPFNITFVPDLAQSSVVKAGEELDLYIGKDIIYAPSKVNTVRLVMMLAEAVASRLLPDYDALKALSASNENAYFKLEVLKALIAYRHYLPIYHATMSIDTDRWNEKTRAEQEKLAAGYVRDLDRYTRGWNGIFQWRVFLNLMDGADPRFIISNYMHLIKRRGVLDDEYADSAISKVAAVNTANMPSLARLREVLKEFVMHGSAWIKIADKTEMVERFGSFDFSDNLTPLRDLLMTTRNINEFYTTLRAVILIMLPLGEAQIEEEMRRAFDAYLFDSPERENSIKQLLKDIVTRYIGAKDYEAFYEHMTAARGFKEIPYMEVFSEGYKLQTGVDPEEAYGDMRYVLGDSGEYDLMKDDEVISTERDCVTRLFPMPQKEEPADDEGGLSGGTYLAMGFFPWRYVRPGGEIDWTKIAADFKAIAGFFKQGRVPEPEILQKTDGSASQAEGEIPGIEAPSISPKDPWEDLDHDTLKERTESLSNSLSLLLKTRNKFEFSSWLHGTKNVQIKMKCDSRFYQFALNVFPVFTSGDYSKYERQLFLTNSNYPDIARGSIGRVLFAVAYVDGEPAIVIQEIQTTYAFRHLPPEIRDRYDIEWITRAGDLIASYGRALGLKNVYSLTGEAVKHRGHYVKLNQERNTYEKPFRDWERLHTRKTFIPGSYNDRFYPLPWYDMFRYDCEKARDPSCYSQYEPWLTGFTDFYPELSGDEQTISVKGEVYVTVDFDKAVKDPDSLRLVLHYGDPAKKDRWQDKEAELVDIYEKSYRFRAILPKNAKEYTFKISYDDGRTWGWMGRNIKVSRINRISTTGDKSKSVLSGGTCLAMGVFPWNLVRPDGGINWAKIGAFFAPDKGASPGGGVSPGETSPLKPVVNGETVGVLRVFHDVREGYKKLWDVKDNEIVGIEFYPTADPTFARPMGILTWQEQAGLSHAAVRARFWGIPHATINDPAGLEALEGKWVYLKVEEGAVTLRPASRDEINNYESYKPKAPTPVLEEVDLTTAPTILQWNHADNPKEVSHKFASLHMVSQAVRRGPLELESRRPDFYINWGAVIPFATYKKVLDLNPGAEDRIRQLILSIDNSDISDIESKLTQAREIITDLDIPESVWGNAEKELAQNRYSSGDWSIDYTVANDTYRGQGIFVRAGTNAEDLPDYPGFGAGMYGTVPNVKREGAKSAIKEAWASVWGLSAYLEREKLGIDHFAVYPAVQLSQAIDARYSFVIHTANPDGNDLDTVYAEIVQGLGEGLVGDKYPGLAHCYRYSKSRDRIISYEPATKEEKAVLDPAGGLRRGKTDYEDDTFYKNRENSSLALELCRIASRVEKAARRPQDIEGAIKWLDNAAIHHIILTQSRSEVGYGPAPAPYEEFAAQNYDKACALIDEFKTKLKRGRTFFNIKSSLQEQFISGFRDKDKSGDGRDSAVLSSYMLRFLTTISEDGAILAGAIVNSARGYHDFAQNVINRMDPETRTKVLTYAAVDYAMLDQEELESFDTNSGYSVARIILNRSPENCRELLSRIPPRELAFLLEEVIAAYEKLTADWERPNIKVSKNEMYEIVRSIFNDMPAGSKEIFVSHLSDNASIWFGIPKEAVTRHITPAEYKKLSDFRYYTHRQAIVVAASTIDGAIGLKSILEDLLRLDKGISPFVMILLMDIPGETKEGFLRRNGLTGDLFDTTFYAAKPALNDKTIVERVYMVINSHKGYSGEEKDRIPSRIVLVGSEETAERYRANDNGILSITAAPQKGEVAFIIRDAIKLLTEKHKNKEAEFSAWLESRGLDGKKRYHEWVYAAERYLETYERLKSESAGAERFYKELYEPLIDEHLLKSVKEEKAARDYQRELNSFIDYIVAKKPASAGCDMLYHAFLGLFRKDKDLASQFIRTRAFEFNNIFYGEVKKLPPLTPEEKAIYGESESVAFLELLSGEAAFPHDKDQLREFVAESDAAIFLNIARAIYDTYVAHPRAVDSAQKDVEEAMIEGAFHNYRLNHMGLPKALSDDPVFSYLKEAARRSGYDIMPMSMVEIKGNPGIFKVVRLPTEREKRSASRRERAKNGEDVIGVTEDDFLEGAVKSAARYMGSIYESDEELEEDDEGRHKTKPTDSGYPPAYDYEVTSFASRFSDPYLRDWSNLAECQDTIEYMAYLDRELIDTGRLLERDEKLPPSIAILLFWILRMEDKLGLATLLLEATSPRIIATLVHYAAQEATNDDVGRFSIHNLDRSRAVLRKIIDHQSETRRAAIEKDLSDIAREFLAGPKKVTGRDIKKEEAARRKALRRQSPGDGSTYLAMTGFPWRWVRPDGGINWAKIGAFFAPDKGVPPGGGVSPGGTSQETLARLKPARGDDSHSGGEVHLGMNLFIRPGPNGEVDWRATFAPFKSIKDFVLLYAIRSKLNAIYSYPLSAIRSTLNAPLGIVSHKADIENSRFNLKDAFKYSVTIFMIGNLILFPIQLLRYTALFHIWPFSILLGSFPSATEILLPFYVIYLFYVWLRGPMGYLAQFMSSGIIASYLTYAEVAAGGVQGTFDYWDISFAWIGALVIPLINKRYQDIRIEEIGARSPVISPKSRTVKVGSTEQIMISASSAGEGEDSIESLLAKIDQAIAENRGYALEIVKQVIFLKNADDRVLCEKYMNTRYGRDPPATTFLYQPSADGARFAIEVLAISGIRAQKLTKEISTVSHDGLHWAYVGGVEPDESASNTYERGLSVLWKLKDILKQNKFSLKDVVRFWNYVGHITAKDANDRQEYQQFNDARGKVFRPEGQEPVRFGKGRTETGAAKGIFYPAATGIGMDSNSLAMECIAVSGSRDDVRVQPLENPWQVDAHRYADKNAAVLEKGASDTKKTSPMFSRGMAVILRKIGRKIIYVSGTASIERAISLNIGDVRAQTGLSIKNMSRVLCQGGGRLKDITQRRAYIKNPSDYESVKSIVERSFPKNPPTTYIIADVCRDNLLVELEAVAHCRYYAIQRIANDIYGPVREFIRFVRTWREEMRVWGAFAPYMRNHKSRHETWHMDGFALERDGIRIEADPKENSISLQRLIPTVFKLYSIDLLSRYDNVAVNLPSGSEDLYIVDEVKARRLRAAIWHTFQNALKYSKSRYSPIAITISVDPSGSLTVEIKDEGIGIPPDEVKSVMDPELRYRATNAVRHTMGTGMSGAGLGLNTAQRIVREGLGGILRIDSNLNQGTIVTITAPAMISKSKPSSGGGAYLSMGAFPWRYVRPDGGIDWARMKADFKAVMSSLRSNPARASEAISVLALFARKKLRPGQFDILKDLFKKALRNVLAFVIGDDRRTAVDMAEVNMASSLPDRLEPVVLKDAEKIGGFEGSEAAHQPTSTSWRPTNSSGEESGRSTSRQREIASRTRWSNVVKFFAWVWHALRAGTVATSIPSSSFSITTRNLFLRIYSHLSYIKDIISSSASQSLRPPLGIVPNDPMAGSSKSAIQEAWSFVKDIWILCGFILPPIHYFRHTFLSHVWPVSILLGSLPSMTDTIALFGLVYLLYVWVLGPMGYNALFMSSASAALLVSYLEISARNGSRGTFDYWDIVFAWIGALVIPVITKRNQEVFMESVADNRYDSDYKRDVSPERSTYLGVNFFIPHSWIRPDGGLDWAWMKADLKGIASSAFGLLAMTVSYPLSALRYPLNAIWLHGPSAKRLFSILEAHQNADREVPVARSLGLDTRPIENGLLNARYVGHDMAIRKIVNPAHRHKTAVYGCSGADISNLLLSTDADEAYFVDQTAVRFVKLEAILDQYWDYLDAEGWNFLNYNDSSHLIEYTRYKYRCGYYYSRGFGMSSIEFKVLMELKMMGVEKFRPDGSRNIVLKRTDDGSITMTFQWQYHGSAPRDYTITFIQADITRPDIYPKILRSVLARGIDIYYQRAAFKVPEYYKDFLGLLAGHVKDGGYLITDDHIAPSGYVNPDDVLSHGKRYRYTKENGMVSPELARWERLAAKFAAANRNLKAGFESYGYGWLVRVRRKSSVSMPHTIKTAPLMANSFFTQGHGGSAAGKTGPAKPEIDGRRRLISDLIPDCWVDAFGEKEAKLLLDIAMEDDDGKRDSLMWRLLNTLAKRGDVRVITPEETAVIHSLFTEGPVTGPREKDALNVYYGMGQTGKGRGDYKAVSDYLNERYNNGAPKINPLFAEKLFVRNPVNKLRKFIFLFITQRYLGQDHPIYLRVKSLPGNERALLLDSLDGNAGLFDAIFKGVPFGGGLASGSPEPREEAYPPEKITTPEGRFRQMPLMEQLIFKLRSGWGTTNKRVYTDAEIAEAANIDPGTLVSISRAFKAAGITPDRAFLTFLNERTDSTDVYLFEWPRVMPGHPRYRDFLNIGRLELMRVEELFTRKGITISDIRSRPEMLLNPDKYIAAKKAKDRQATRQAHTREAVKKHDAVKLGRADQGAKLTQGLPYDIEPLPQEVMDKVASTENVGQRIAYIRESKGYTRRQVFEEGSVPERTYLDIENTGRLPRPESLFAISSVLEVDPAYVIYGKSFGEIMPTLSSGKRLKLLRYRKGWGTYYLVGCLKKAGYPFTSSDVKTNADMVERWERDVFEPDTKEKRIIIQTVLGHDDIFTSPLGRPHAMEFKSDGDIMQAIRELREELAGPLMVADVAVKAGVNRSTVREVLGRNKEAGRLFYESNKVTRKRQGELAKTKGKEFDMAREIAGSKSPWREKVLPQEVYELLSLSDSWGFRIELIRLARGLSLGEAAERGSLKYSTYKVSEKRPRCGEETLISISRALDVDPILIISGMDLDGAMKAAAPGKKIEYLRLIKGWRYAEFVKELLSEGFGFGSDKERYRISYVAQLERGRIPEGDEARRMIEKVLGYKDIFSSPESAKPEEPDDLSIDARSIQAKMEEPYYNEAYLRHPAYPEDIPLRMDIVDGRLVLVEDDGLETLSGALGLDADILKLALDDALSIRLNLLEGSIPQGSIVSLAGRILRVRLCSGSPALMGDDSNNGIIAINLEALRYILIKDSMPNKLGTINILSAGFTHEVLGHEIGRDDETELTEEDSLFLHVIAHNYIRYMNKLLGMITCKDSALAVSLKNKIAPTRRIDHHPLKVQGLSSYHSSSYNAYNLYDSPAIMTEVGMLHCHAVFAYDASTGIGAESHADFTDIDHLPLQVASARVAAGLNDMLEKMVARGADPDSVELIVAGVDRYSYTDLSIWNQDVLRTALNSIGHSYIRLPLNGDGVLCDLATGRVIDTGGNSIYRFKSPDHSGETGPAAAGRMPARPANVILRDIADHQELAFNLKEFLASVSLNRKVVLAFDEEIGRGQAGGALSVFGELERIKKETKLLENLVIVKGSVSSLCSRLQEHILKGDAEIFTFALIKNKPETAMRARVNITYIDETRFPSSAYYPLAQIVAITIARYMDEESVRELLEDPARLGGFNVKDVRVDPLNDDILIFTLLPEAKELETYELMKQYAALKQFLRAA